MEPPYFSARFRILALLTIFSFIAVLGINGFTSNDSSSKAKGSNQVEIKIDNKTQALQIISKQNINDRFFSLSLKNSSDKAITAFVVGFGRNQVTTEFIFDESRFIFPENIFTETYPLPSETPVPEFIIQAVVFD